MKELIRYGRQLIQSVQKTRGQIELTIQNSSAYPTVCIPPPPPDLNCDDISYRNFTSLPSDTHGFDGYNEGRCGE